MLQALGNFMEPTPYMPLAPRISRTLLNLLRPPLDGRRLDSQLERYMAAVAAPRLGIGPRRGQQSRVGEGRNTAVRRWETPSHGTLYARGWRYDLRRRPAAAHIAAGRLLRNAGLNVPEIVLEDDTAGTLWRWRLEAVIERAAPGRPLLECVASRKSAARETPWSDAIVSAVAHGLRSLHSVRGEAWGAPWRPENEMAEPRGFWLGRAAKLRNRIPGKLVSLTSEFAIKRLDELAREVEQIPFRQPTLVHGDLSPAHLFAEEQDGSFKLAWIDFETVQFGHPAQDWAVVRRWPMPPGTFERMLEISFEKSQQSSDENPIAAKEEFFRALDIFERLRLWEKLSSRIVKQARHDATMSAERRGKLNAEQASVERQIADVYSET